MQPSTMHLKKIKEQFLIQSESLNVTGSSVCHSKSWILNDSLSHYTKNSIKLSRLSTTGVKKNMSSQQPSILKHGVIELQNLEPKAGHLDHDCKQTNPVTCC